MLQLFKSERSGQTLSVLISSFPGRLHQKKSAQFLKPGMSLDRAKLRP